MGKWHLGETCPECGGPVRRIMWGMPMPEDVERAERKGWILGGCCIDDRHSMCECGATAYDIDGNPVGANHTERLDMAEREGGPELDRGSPDPLGHRV